MKGWLNSIWQTFFPPKQQAKVITLSRPKMITTEILQQIAPSMNVNRLFAITELLNELCPKYKLTSKEAFRKFLSNVTQESGEFSHKSENMNYTSAARIKAIWPSRFPTLESAQPFVRNPQALANKVYGGRMGNTEENDGWLYRGSSFIGITGKDTYTKYANYIGKPVEEASNLMRTTDRYALDASLWFFCVLKEMIPIAETQPFERTVKLINGGLIGLKDRLIYYERCKKFLV